LVRSERGKSLAEREGDGVPRFSPVSPRCQAANDKRRYLRIPGLWREIPQQILFSPFGRFERGRKERERRD
jgi:hypothetical protein